MKHQLTTLLFLAITSLMYAQHNSSIDLVGSIEYSYRTYTYSGEDSFLAGFPEDLKTTEAGKSNWRFGFNYNKRLSDNLFLKTGLRLASVGYKGQESDGFRWGTDHDGMGGYTPSTNTNELSEIQIISNFIFLEVPIIARWEWNSKKWSPFIEAGVSPHIYLTNRDRQITNIDNEVYWSRNKIGDLQTLQLVASLSFGVNYQMNEALQLFAQPVGRYHLTSLGKGDVKERLWSVGLECGVRKGF